MSKNYYRVTSKNDLDEIMTNNFYKPIGITFVNNKLDYDYLQKVVELFKVNAKKNNYMVHLIINLDDFEDSSGFFNELRNKVMPFYIAYFKLKDITRFDNSTEFLNEYIDISSAINDHYKNKLHVFFNANNQNNQDNQPNDERTHQSLKSKIIQSDNKSVTKDKKDIKEVQNKNKDKEIEYEMKSVIDNNIVVKSEVKSEQYSHSSHHSNHNHSNQDMDSEERLLNEKKKELQKLLDLKKKLESESQ